MCWRAATDARPKRSPFAVSELVRLLRKLRAMRRSLPGRDQLLLRISSSLLSLRRTPKVIMFVW